MFRIIPELGKCGRGPDDVLSEGTTKLRPPTRKGSCTLELLEGSMGFGVKGGGVCLRRLSHDRVRVTTSPTNGNQGPDRGRVRDTGKDLIGLVK